MLNWFIFCLRTASFVERHGRVALSTLEEVETLLVDKLVLSHQILSSGLAFLASS